MDPSFYEQPLAYAWPFHAWVAAIARLAGATPFLTFPWVTLVVSSAVAFLLLALARRSGLDGRAALFAVVLTLCAMNALGLLQAAVTLELTPYLGRHRGGPSLAQHVALAFDSPEPGRIASVLIYRGHRVLSSFLYKFLCVNTVATSLMLVVAAHASALEQWRRGTGGRALLTTLFVAGAAIAHPVVGVSAGVALAVGLSGAWALAGAGGGPRTLLAVLLGLGLAAPPLLVMLDATLRDGVRVRVHPHPANLFALVQTMLVSGALALAGLRRAWRHDREALVLAAGFTAAAVGVSLVVEFPSDAVAYPVYVAYLGSAWLLPHGLAALRDATAARPLLRRSLGAGLAFVPLTTAALLLAFLFNDPRRGLMGFPETPDERAVFDRLGRTPVTSLVMDTQNFQMSAAAAYSARRSVFGGMGRVRLAGYPEARMRERERAIRDLLFAPTTSDATWRVLDGFGPPLYVVARRRPSGGRVFDDFEEPPGDPIAKLEGLPERLEPVLRTATVALYRYRRRTG